MASSRTAELTSTRWVHPLKSRIAQRSKSHSNVFKMKDFHGFNMLQWYYDTHRALPLFAYISIFIFKEKNKRHLWKGSLCQPSLSLSLEPQVIMSVRTESAPTVHVVHFHCSSCCTPGCCAGDKQLRAMGSSEIFRILPVSAPVAPSTNGFTRALFQEIVLNLICRSGWISMALANLV